MFLALAIPHINRKTWVFKVIRKSDVLVFSNEECLLQRTLEDTFEILLLLNLSHFKLIWKDEIILVSRFYFFVEVQTNGISLDRSMCEEFQCKKERLWERVTACRGCLKCDKLDCYVWTLKRIVQFEVKVQIAFDIVQISAVNVHKTEFG